MVKYEVFLNEMLRFSSPKGCYKICSQNGPRQLWGHFSNISSMKISLLLKIEIFNFTIVTELQTALHVLKWNILLSFLYSLKNYMHLQSHVLQYQLSCVNSLYFLLWILTSQLWVYKVYKTYFQKENNFGCSIPVQIPYEPQIFTAIEIRNC